MKANDMMTTSKILIVEDEGIVALDIQMRLENKGYEICGIAATGQDAINQAQSKNPSLILMDINLKGQMNGIEASKTIRQNQDIPIIYLTANTDEGTLNKAKITAPYGYIMKPFEERSLFATIESAFYRHLDQKKTLEQSQQIIQTYAKQTHILNELDKKIIHSLDIDYVLHSVLHASIELSDAISGYIGLINNNIWDRIQIENYPEAITQKTRHVDPDIVHLIHEQEAQFISDCSLEPLIVPIHTEGAKIAIPFELQDNLAGILYLWTPQPEGFSPQIFETLQSLITRTMVIIENAHLYHISQSQIHELQQLHEELLQYSYRDMLTGLGNRRQFDEYIETLVSQNLPFNVLYIDLDGFKAVNDNYGHLTGDQLLIEISNRLQDHLTPSDLLVRLGGDEFLVIQHQNGHTTSDKELVAQIIDDLQQDIQVGQYNLKISASIGIAKYPEHGTSQAELLRCADRALYHAKETGKNHTEWYASHMDSRISDVTISQQLQGALERNELVLYYQPELDTFTGQIVGAECLLRWHHPNWGVVLPNEFIPIACNNELIIPITEWVIAMVCLQHKEWQQAGFDIFVSVNVTPQQFETDQFIETLKYLLEKYDVDPEYLKIEITEDFALSDGKNNKYLQQIDEMGIDIIIDDFGKGYSSFDYMQKEFIKTIKIDKFLIQGIGDQKITRQKSEEIIKAIIELAHNLGLQVVAEGVETRLQHEVLKSLGCDIVQGFLFSKPISSAAITTLLDGSQLS